MSPNVSNKSAFDDDQYLLPVLEDDALLYTLEEAIGDLENSREQSASTANMSDQSYDRVIVLEKELRLVKQQLKSITKEYTGYKALMSKAADNQFQSLGDFVSNFTANYEDMHSATPALQDDDTHYFNSYSYNGKSIRGLVFLILSA